MVLFFHLIFTAAWVLNVQASNDTVYHGWKVEPHSRGTWSILWSCLATIFICTWSVLHLDVPERHSRWYLYYRKFKWMLVATVAPEIILLSSSAGFFAAQKASRHLARHGHEEWTLTHMQFAEAGGFWYREPGEGLTACDIHQLQEMIEKGHVAGPPVSEEELRSRGKSDLVLKLIAILQIVWFAAHTLVRAIKHYHIAVLEIATVAFVFCSIFSYGFYLNQPQDVEYPMVLEIPHASKLKGSSRWKDSYLNYVNCPLCVLFTSGFGAIHCLAWNLPFPTPQERLAWRVCSVMTTAVALVALNSVWALDKLSDEGRLSERLQMVFDVTISGSFLLYAIGRITIIVLAFMDLRALPTDTFYIVNWGNYIPHFAV
ncbi:MAG: hypothetical protein Q9167_000294 [Letrouitia subvulpina]